MEVGLVCQSWCKFCLSRSSLYILIFYITSWFPSHHSPLGQFMSCWFMTFLYTYNILCMFHTHTASWCYHLGLFKQLQYSSWWVPLTHLPLHSGYQLFASSQVWCKVHTRLLSSGYPDNASPNQSTVAKLCLDLNITGTICLQTHMMPIKYKCNDFLIIFNRYSQTRHQMYPLINL